MGSISKHRLVKWYKTNHEVESRIDIPFNWCNTNLEYKINPSRRKNAHKSYSNTISKSRYSIICSHKMSKFFENILYQFCSDFSNFQTQSRMKTLVHTWLWTYLWFVRLETNLWQILQKPALVPWPGSCGWIVPGPETEFWGKAPETGAPVYNRINLWWIEKGRTLFNITE